MSGNIKGTNLLATLLVQNCHLPEREAKHGEQSRGMRWQVPWGKWIQVGCINMP